MMGIMDISLSLIEANPWQTRIGAPDEEYLAGLAEDIRVNGLLQTPMGRLANGENGVRKVQLAFGHNRVTAYQRLLLSFGEEWAKIKIDIRELNDQQMADYAWSENEKRRDVSPLERAQAIRKRMEDFGWTETQASEHLGLNRSTVANILRLLELPQEIKTAMLEGKISERSALALLGLYELPMALRERAESHWNTDGKPSLIIKDALAGVSSEEVRSRVNSIVERLSEKLKQAEWRVDDDLPGDKVRSTRCKDCEWRLKQRNACMDPDCYRLKGEMYRDDYLRKASKAGGVPVIESDVDRNAITQFRPYEVSEASFKTIRASGCVNLRIAYNSQADTYNQGITLKWAGFPNAMYVCKKRNSFCTCMNGLKAKWELDARNRVEAEEDLTPDPFPKREGETIETDVMPAQAMVDPEPTIQYKDNETMTAEKLEQFAKQARKEKREAEKMAALVKIQVGERIMAGMKAGNVKVWKMIGGAINYPLGKADDAEQIMLEIGNYLANQAMPYDIRSIDQVMQSVNAKLGHLGLALIEEAKPSYGNVLERWERVQEWIATLHTQCPSLVEITTMKTELEDIARLGSEAPQSEREWLGELYDDGALDEAILCLTELEELIYSPAWSAASGNDGFYQVEKLVSLPVEAISWGEYLKSAPAHLLNYALLLVSGQEGQGKRAGMIRGRLNMVMQEIERANG